MIRNLYDLQALFIRQQSSQTFCGDTMAHVTDSIPVNTGDQMLIVDTTGELPTSYQHA
jgi:hypothetical protein